MDDSDKLVFACHDCNRFFYEFWELEGHRERTGHGQVKLWVVRKDKKDESIFEGLYVSRYICPVRLSHA